MHLVGTRLERLAAATTQPLLQTRLLALGPGAPGASLLLSNPALHTTVRAVITLDGEQRAKLLGNPARLAALLSKLPLVLPAEGFRVRERQRP